MARKDSIGIGVIGTGFARRTQLPAFKACEGARIVSIASGHLENAEKAAREFDIEHFTDDWRAVLERDEVDLISIVTPPATHLEMTLAALDAGKAVLCEKPMAMNAGETEAMTRRARETGLLALIDHELRFLPGRRKMRELIRAGEIGRIYHAKLHFRADSRADATRAWDWWSDERAGGGTLGAIGSHAVDAFRWLLSTEVTQVNGLLATHVRQRALKETGETRAVTTDDEANLTLRFADGELMQGATGTISLSVVESGRPEHRLEVFGATGALILEGDKLSRSRTGEGAWQVVETEPAELAAGMSDNEWSRGFTIFSRAVIEALRAGQATVEDAATFEDGHRTQLVLDAAHHSHESGCAETIEESQI